MVEFNEVFGWFGNIVDFVFVFKFMCEVLGERSLFWVVWVIVVILLLIVLSVWNFFMIVF